MLALVVWGARVSLLVGIAATVISMAIGTLVGIASGHFGGWLGGILERLTDWFLVIPFLPLAIALATVLGCVAAQRHRRHRRDVVAGHGPAGAGPDAVRRGPAVPRARPRARRRALAPDVAARAAQRHAAGARQHDPDRRDRDPVRDDAVVPRPRRPVPGLLGLDAGQRVLRRRDQRRRLVVPAAARCLRGRRGAGLHAGRPGAGERPRPAGAGDRDRCCASRTSTVTYRTLGRARCPPSAASRSTSRRARALGVAGESGSGKSTLAATVLRLTPRSAKVAGRVLLDGEDVLAMSFGRLRAVRWSEASIVFQGALHSLNPLHRVGRQIAEPVLLHDRTATRRAGGRRRSRGLLGQVGLPARLASSYPHQLSGGQKQRVMIAMALACKPRLIDRRRADDGAGRDGAGAGARPAHLAGARPAASGSSSSATTCPCSARPATGSL